MRWDGPDRVGRWWWSGGGRAREVVGLREVVGGWSRPCLLVLLPHVRQIPVGIVVLPPHRLPEALLHLEGDRSGLPLADLDEIGEVEPDCPVAVVWRASWPDQRIVKATLATLQTAIGAEMERTALILVGHALGSEDFGESRLYAGDYDRRFRPVGTDPRFPETAE